MQMALDCGSWPRTIFFPKVKLLSIVEAASSSILMGLNPWFLCSNGRIYHSISILNWLLPMWKKDIGRKAYWLLAKLEKRYMCIFLRLLPDHLALHPRLLQCLICSSPWDGDSHGSLSLARRRRCHIVRGRGGECEVLISYLLLLQHHISGSCWIIFPTATSNTQTLFYSSSTHQLQ